MSIHLARKAQLAWLLTEKITVPTEYSDFANVFLEKSANVLPEQTGAKKHAIELEKSKQPPYGPIYSLGPVKLETLKTYIKNNLANNFIQASNSTAGTLHLLLVSLIAAFACVSITKGSITSPSKIGIRCRWLASS